VLSACGAPSSDAPIEDFAAPPVEPIAVDGLRDCVGLERQDPGSGQRGGDGLAGQGLDLAAIEREADGRGGGRDGP